MERLNGGYSYVTCFKIPFDEIDKVDFATCKEPREALSSYYNRQEVKPDILSNGGYFGMTNGVPCINFEDEDVVKAFDSNLKYGIGITHTGEVKFGAIDDGTDYRDFLSAYPVLVNNGQLEPIVFGKEIAGANPRSALGIGDGFLIHVAVDGRKTGKPGMTLTQLANLMLKFGCKYAINLDGGGSTRMLYKGSVVNVPCENRPVDNVVAIYLKGSNYVPQPVPAGTDRIYTVKSGDSFWKIAQDNMGNGTRYATLAQYNGLSTTSRLVAGQKLKIPYAYDTKKSSGTIVNSSITDNVPTAPLYTTYIVKTGDSLWTIAQKLLGDGSKYPIIMEYNGMKKAFIYNGQVLKIPV